MNKYSIGEAAKLSGLTTKTIRFYEEKEVITSAVREDNGYRSYPQSAIEELKILKYARDLGLPLSEIKKLILGCDKGDCKHSKIFVEKSINNYLEMLDIKMSQMANLKDKLTELRHKLDSEDTNCNEGPFCCNILHQLVDVSNEKGGGIND